MTKEEKFEVILERCDKYWETEEICFGCPIWEYMKKNSQEGDLLICADVDVDTAYELLVNDGTC